MPKKSVQYPLRMKIIGIGKYLPKRVVDSSEIEKHFNLEEGWCERKLGISKRHWVSKDESISSIGAKAARQAVSNSNISLSDIDLVINASNFHDQIIPDQSVLFGNELGLNNSKVDYMSIKAGCLSFIKALEISSNLLAVDRYKNILIISSSVISIGFDKCKDPLIGCMMGDGAGAVVVTKSKEDDKSRLHAARMETYGKGADGHKLANDSNSVFENDFSPENDLFDFDHKLIQDVGLENNQKFLKRLSPSGYEAFKLIIPIQANKLAISVMSFIFPPNKIKGIVSYCGNLGAASYPIALYEAVKNQEIKRGDMVMMHGIGAGVSLCGAIFTY